ncbi:MAG: hypothetical protein Wins2KO_32400 [Winogradskyella sp.]
MFKEYSEQDKEITKKVGERIQFLRQQKGISLDKLSIEAELSKNQVWRIENHKHNTSLVALNRIAIALEVSLKDLFDFEQQENTSN